MYVYIYIYIYIYTLVILMAISKLPSMVVIPVLYLLYQIEVITSKMCYFKMQQCYITVIFLKETNLCYAEKIPPKLKDSF